VQRDNTRKTHASFGTFQHGLLLQRATFAQGVQVVMTQHPAVAPTLRAVFASSDSPFLLHSDNLLQFVCGKRAGTLEARRAIIEAAVPGLAPRLRTVPPSSQFLYDDANMTELVHQLPPPPSVPSSFRRSSGPAVPLPGRFQGALRAIQSPRSPDRLLDLPPGRRPRVVSAILPVGPTVPVETSPLPVGRCTLPENTVGRQASHLPVDGRLRVFRDRWASLGASSTLLKVIGGYSLPFKQVPPLAPLGELLPRFATPASPAMDEAIQEMLRSRIIQPAFSRQGFLSRIFLVSKPDGSHRPIFNLKRLNAYLALKPFRLFSHFRVPGFLQRHDYLVKIDISQAYCHVPIKLTHRRFLSLAYRNRLYHMSCLPFGLASPPRLSRPSPTVVYPDDFLITHQDPSVLSAHATQALHLLRSLGWTVNLAKCSLTPSKELQFLGLLWNPSQNEVRLPADKRGRIASLLNALLQAGSWTWQDGK